VSARPFRLKGVFNVEFYQSGTPDVLLYSETKRVDEGLSAKAEPQVDTDERGVKRVTHSTVECELPLGEYNPVDVAKFKDTDKVVLTFPNKKVVTIDGVEYCYTSMDGMMPKVIFGLIVVGEDWTSAFAVTEPA